MKTLKEKEVALLSIRNLHSLALGFCWTLD